MTTPPASCAPRFRVLLVGLLLISLTRLFADQHFDEYIQFILPLNPLKYGEFSRTVERWGPAERARFEKYYSEYKDEFGKYHDGAPYFGLVRFPHTVNDALAFLKAHPDLTEVHFASKSNPAYLPGWNAAKATYEQAYKDTLAAAHQREAEQKHKEFMDKVNNVLGIIGLIIASPFAVAAYFIPTIIAKRRKHPQLIPIFFVNLLLGEVFGLGWVIAFIWALMRQETVKVEHSFQAPAQDHIAQLERLADLREKGFLSEAEFAEQKARLLS